ncbi:DUF1553 domain-containing protein [bacterium]|nr:DUF1553 domain-containing protein [bacterium]
MKRLTGFTFCFLIVLSTGRIIAADISFDRDVRPILSDKCFPCHGPDIENREAGLRLDTFEGATADLDGYAAVVPGDVKNSVLLQRIDGDADRMPPPDSKLTLSPGEKDVLRRWIAEGAKWAKHWAFVAPQRPDIPQNEFDAHPIDAFVGERLKQAGLTFSPEATPERLIRRATLDLTGLPPTIAEVDSFVAAFQRDGEAAWSALIDRLLDSPRYGETMALPWLDAARYADTDGYQFDGPRYQWRWRDWVIDAYNAKMPFDQFTVEQLAGDLLPDATLEQMIATGFNRNHRYNSEAGLVVEEFLLENAVDRVETTSTLWMGLTMGCARCHDHKYDPFTQRDYYGMIAFFNSVPEAGRAIKYGNSEPVILAPTRDQQAELAAKEQALAGARAELKPTGEPQQGGPLIDRKLVHRYALDSLPEENVKANGQPVFKDGALTLDGASTLELSGQKKSLSLRADSEFTVSFWLRPDSLVDSVIVSRQKGGTTRPGIELALVDGGRIQFDLITRWVAGTGRVTTKTKLAAGEWVHVTISNDGSQSANGQLIYLNGQPAETTVTYNTNSNTGGVDANRPLIVGGGIRPGAKNFTGAIRDLRLHETNLWPEEVAVLGEPLGSPARKELSRTKTTPGYARYVKLREDLEKYRRSLPTVMVMQDAAEPTPSYIRKRGVYHAYGEQVPRGTIAEFPPMDESLPRNRLGFAKWLVSPRHPLTARVAVNRYWQKYFGTGLVKTAEDFGVQGDPPSHPELLDWLATEFVRSGWDVATMQKLIMTSRTYRQVSRVTPELLEKDPENRLLARGPRIRLTGHALRDQALFVSGLLKERIGGPSVSPYQPANLWAEMSMGMKYQQSKGDDLYRRSLYTIWKRTVAPPAMAVFDAADREACWVKRKQTNTPLQALTLLNETGFIESARHFAVRMLKEGGNDPLNFGFRCITARHLKSTERDILQAALDEYRDQFAASPKEADRLISTGESPKNTDFDAVEIAAYTALANVLLNLDEVITRE